MYFPEENIIDWSIITAGQRVQVIKKDENGDGELRFGTEVVCSEDGSIAALLGASTSVSIMLDVLEKMFPTNFASEARQKDIMEMISTYGQSLIEDGTLCIKTRNRTSKLLNLD